MKYYYNDGSDTRGPFEKSELIDKGITAETMVWVEGMAAWLPAGQVPMFADILDGSFAANYRANTQSTPSDSPQVNPVSESAAPNNGMSSATNESSNMPNNPNYNQQNGYGQPGYGQQNPYQNQQPGYGQQQYPQQPQQYPQQPQQYPQQQYPQQPQQQYAQQPVDDMELYRPSTSSGWTITGTVLGGIGILVGLIPFFLLSLPFGIASLVCGIVGLSKGGKVNKYWVTAHYQEAQVTASQAKKLGLCSVFIAVGGMIAQIIAYSITAATLSTIFPF